MDIQDCKIAGLKIIRCKMLDDHRGFFAERFHADRLKQAGIAGPFIQDNHSRSNPGVLRGLHYQHTPPQGKLVGVIRGRIWDVAVDIRPGSPTFGKHHGVELSDENGLLFWLPAGFAHGFCVLDSEPADVVYKMDQYYAASGENGIRHDDKDLAIDWPVKQPALSDRDKQLPSWRDYCASPPAWRKAS